MINQVTCYHHLDSSCISKQNYLHTLTILQIPLIHSITIDHHASIDPHYNKSLEISNVNVHHVVAIHESVYNTQALYYHGTCNVTLDTFIKLHVE